MLTIKIYLKESGQVADMKKDFPVYQGQFNNILLNVFVPTSLLAPYFQEIANGAVVSPYVAGTAVKIAMRTIERNGSYKMSNDHYLRYIKTLAKDGVSYALFERKMPQEFTNYAGQGVNAPTLIINAVNVQYGEISSATAVSSNTALTVTTDITKVKANLPAISAVYTFKYNKDMSSWTIDGAACNLDDYGITVTGVPADQNVITLTIVASEPVVTNTLTSQTVNIDVQPSSSLDNDVPKAADEWANTQAKINSLTAQINALINAVAQRQTIDDKKLRTTNKQIVPSINEVNEKTNTNTSDISDIQQTLTDIGNTFSMGENPIGTMKGSSLPTQEELNAFVVANTDPSRNPKAGDTIIFVLLIPNATDKNYKYIYSGETKSWGKFEIPPLEAAGNGSLGIIEGTYNVSGKDYSILVDIVSGEIKNIFIKAGVSDNYVNLKEFYDFTALTFNEIEDGDKKVGLAQKAIEDNAGNVIDATYLKKTDGVTKQYVVDYALPKEFNNVFYLTDNGYVEERPKDSDFVYQFDVRSETIGYTTLFEESFTLGEVELQLGSKNAYSNTIFIGVAALYENVTLHLTTSITQGSTTTVLAITDVPVRITGDGVRIEFKDTLNRLGVTVIEAKQGDIITQKLEVFREESTSRRFIVSSTEHQPSMFYLYTGAVSVVNATVVQETGNSQANVMSQNAVTQELEKRLLKGKSVKFPFGDPTVTYDTTDGMHIVGTMRVYTTEDKSSYYDIENVDVEIPLIADGGTMSMDANTANTQLRIEALKGVSSVEPTSMGALEFTLSDGTLITTDPLGGQGMDIGAGLPASATSGTLTEDQLLYLQSFTNNYIMLQNEKYTLADLEHVSGFITYTHTGYESGTYWIKSITITVSTRAWVLNKGGLAGKGLGFDADGKLQVKAGANLSFGEDGTLNASGGGTANEYANTSEIVDNAITLTNTSTLDDLVTQILAQKTKVVRMDWDENLQRLIPLPVLPGPPDEFYDVYFKVWSDYPLVAEGAYFESRIDCFATPARTGSDSKWDYRGYINGASGKYFSGWVSESNPYPVGAIYIAAATAGSSVVNNPANCFGGTWEYIEEGRFLLSATPPMSEDPTGQAYPAGSTGGEATHTLVLSEMPAHIHSTYVSVVNNGGNFRGILSSSSDFGTNKAAYEGNDSTVSGGNAAHNNMPPYLAVCMWKRIA